MAFDFTKLNQETPEERERDLQEQHERMIAHIQSLIAERKPKIEALRDKLGGLNEKDARFVRDLAYKAETFDLSGVQGGALSDLSDSQLNYLNGLHQRYCGVSAAAVKITPPRA